MYTLNPYLWSGGAGVGGAGGGASTLARIRVQGAAGCRVQGAGCRVPKSVLQGHLTDKKWWGRSWWCGCGGLMANIAHFTPYPLTP